MKELAERKNNHDPLEEAKEDIIYVLSIHPSLENQQLCVSNDTNGVNSFCKWIKDQDFWNNHDLEQLAQLEILKAKVSLNDLQEESCKILKREIIKNLKILVISFLDEQKAISEIASESNKDTFRLIS